MLWFDIADAVDQTALVEAEPSMAPTTAALMFGPPTLSESFYGIFSKTAVIDFHYLDRHSDRHSDLFVELSDRPNERPPTQVCSDRVR